MLEMMSIYQIRDGDIPNNYVGKLLSKHHSQATTLPMLLWTLEWT